MKVTFFLLLIFFSFHAFGQSDTLTHSNNSNFERRLDSLKMLDVVKYCGIYADSINSFSLDLIPTFLYNVEFDSKFSFLWKSKADPFSIRYSILEEVDDVDALERILLINDKRLKSTCKNDYFNVPFIEYSWKELIQLRIERIRHEKKMKLIQDG